MSTPGIREVHHQVAEFARGLLAEHPGGMIVDPQRSAGVEPLAVRRRTPPPCTTRSGRRQPSRTGSYLAPWISSVACPSSCPPRAGLQPDRAVGALTSVRHPHSGSWDTSPIRAIRLHVDPLTRSARVRHPRFDATAPVTTQAAKRSHPRASAPAGRRAALSEARAPSTASRRASPLDVFRSQPTPRPRHRQQDRDQPECQRSHEQVEQQRSGRPAAGRRRPTPASRQSAQAARRPASRVPGMAGVRRERRDRSCPGPVARLTERIQPAWRPGRRGANTQPASVSGAS